jgi:hypothetical protein
MSIPHAHAPLFFLCVLHVIGFFALVDGLQKKAYSRSTFDLVFLLLLASWTGFMHGLLSGMEEPETSVCPPACPDTGAS